MSNPTARRALVAAAFGLVAVSTAAAQEHTTYGPSDPMNVAITVRGGIAVATPRGDFPSLIVGDSRRGSGEIGQEHGEARSGGRVKMAALIPVLENLGILLALGSQALSVGYPEDSLRLATRFDVQTLQGVIGVQYSFINEPMSYLGMGLRSIYVDGGLDIGLAALNNRVESTSYDDTVGTARRPAVGSFTSGEPFRTTVALRGAVGLRFAPSPNFEIVAEGSYSHALNPLFSSEAISDNDFTIDVLSAVLGIGYRF